MWVIVCVLILVTSGSKQRRITHIICLGINDAVNSRRTTYEQIPSVLLYLFQFHLKRQALTFLQASSNTFKGVEHSCTSRLQFQAEHIRGLGYIYLTCSKKHEFVSIPVSGTPTTCPSPVRPTLLKYTLFAIQERIQEQRITNGRS